jgi:acyl-CoA hydrolase
MFSVNTAVELDLTGQVCSESVGHIELSGVGGAHETHIGAQRSAGGRGIIAIRSSCEGPNASSKIVFELKPGAKVSVSRNDIDTVVTEYGVARLAGLSVSRRVKALIGIAHPQFRDELLRQAVKNNYI